MKTSVYIFIFAWWVMQTNCKPAQLVTTYKNPALPERHYSHILVSAALPCTTDSFKHSVETWLVTELKKRNFPASASGALFAGTYPGADNPTDAFRQLCDAGIDAVIVIAAISESKDAFGSSIQSTANPNSFYFERVWNYPRILADCSGDTGLVPGTYYWEVVVIDLATLEAQACIQARPSPDPDSQKQAAQIIRQLTHQRVLLPPPPAGGRR